ncbi:hypothetical protein T310_5872, partial [Rasamsonia emersonii CBS 393.64]
HILSDPPDELRGVLRLHFARLPHFIHKAVLVSRLEDPVIANARVGNQAATESNDRRWRAVTRLVLHGSQIMRAPAHDVFDFLPALLIRSKPQQLRLETAEHGDARPDDDPIALKHPAIPHTTQALQVQPVREERSEHWLPDILIRQPECLIEMAV